VVAQIDEEQVAVIPLAVDPASQAHGLADVLGPQHLTGVRAVGIHS
jgi:hypothetical protein